MRYNLGEKEKLTERDSGISEGNREGKWAMSDDVYILIDPNEFHDFYACLKVICKNNNSRKTPWIESKLGSMGKFRERNEKINRELL